MIWGRKWLGGVDRGEETIRGGQSIEMIEKEEKSKGEDDSEE